jgi:hypothetical protein
MTLVMNNRRLPELKPNDSGVPTCSEIGAMSGMRKVGVSGRIRRGRRGASSMDYFLIIAIIVPLVTFLFTIVPRMIQLVYEMAIVIIDNPIM